MATAIITKELNSKTKSVLPTQYPIVQIEPITYNSVIMSTLPFRVKFSAIQIEAITDNIPAIPFQIIGYSNYIL